MSDGVVVRGEHRLHLLWTGGQISVKAVAGEQTGWRIDAGHSVWDV